MYLINWTFELDVANETDGNLALMIIESKLETSMIDLVTDSETEDYQVIFNTNLTAQNDQQAVFQTLQLADKLGKSWEIEGPQYDSQNSLEFHGIRDNYDEPFSIIQIAEVKFRILKKA